MVEFRDVFLQMGVHPQGATRADNALRNLAAEWRRSDATMLEDAAHFILANPVKILMVGNSGRKTLTVLESFAQGVLDGSLTVEVDGDERSLPMEHAMAAVYNRM